MNTKLEAVFECTVRGLLCAYPPPFRARFGSEMLQVYRALASQAAKEVGFVGFLHLWLQVLWDGVFGALAQWRDHLMKRRMATMNLDRLDVKDGTTPLAPRQAVLAVLPFLLFGAANIAMQLGVGQAQPGSSPVGIMLVTHPYLLFNWLILLGLAAGVLCGFPRWAFSYLSWALLDALWWANLSFYGQLLNLMCLPLAAAIIVPLLIRRSLRPAHLLLPGLWRYLSLLPLGIYVVGTSVYTMFDENHHPALIFFIAASALAATLGAWGYFRSTSPLNRALALTGGLALAALINLWNNLTWDSAAYYGTPPSSPLQSILSAVTGLAVWAAVLLALGWLAERLSRRKAA